MYPPIGNAPPTDPPVTTPDTTEQERQLVSLWNKRVSHSRKHDDRYRKRWFDDRRIARNDPKEGEPSWLVDTNNIGAIIEVLLSFLYARDPDVSVRPAPATGKNGKEKYREFAETLQTVLSGLFKQGRLKRKGKRWIRSAMTVGIGWIKATFLTRTERDPIAESTLNDLQDNIKRTEMLQALIASGECASPEMAQAQLELQQIAMQGRLEREIAEGIALDVMTPEDVVVSAECGPVENYLDAPWIAFDIYRTKDKALAFLGWKTPEQLATFKKASLYMQRDRGGESDKSSAANTYVQIPVGADEDESIDGFVKFIEIWSVDDGVVMTMLEGVDQWARPPYAPRTGSRYYPCFEVMFHPIDGERYPQSDVFMLKKLGEEYARTRSNYAEHRRRAIPGVIFDETQIEPESITKLVKSQTQEYCGVKPISWGVDLRTLFAPKLYNPVDPGLYNTDAIRVDMERISGAQDAMQSAVAVEKTATEAKIQDTGFGARVGARRDAIEDSLTELSQYIAELALQIMDLADAQRFAGPDAVWAQLSPEEAMTLFAIDIKAGSTGKPKANSDREVWGTLLPLIESMIGKIGAARMNNQEWAAKPLIELLAETFKRLDDPAEVDRFLPVPPVQTGIPGMPGAIPDMAQGDPGMAPGVDPTISPVGTEVGAAPMPTV